MTGSRRSGADELFYDKRYLPFLLIALVAALAIGLGALALRAKKRTLADRGMVRSGAGELELIPTHVRGPASAPVTLEEYADFQCPSCATVSNVVHAAAEKYRERLRVIFWEFPLPFHQHARLAAIAAEAASRQGRFWEEWYRESQVSMENGVGPHGIFVHLYINGLYWGLYNACERPDESFAAIYLGGDKDNRFSLNMDGRTSGDATRWNYLTDTLMGKDMTVAANYSELQGYLDVKEFSDYLILAWYQAVTDWPSNNWYLANRNATDPLGVTPAKYFMWDGEWCWDRGNQGVSVFGAWVHPSFRPGATDTNYLPKLWRLVRPNSDFMTTFADRVYLHNFNNGALTDQNSRSRWSNGSGGP